MPPEFKYLAVPEVIIYWMTHVPNDANPDCICKELSVYDYSSPDFIGHDFEMERGHISGLLYLVSLMMYFYSL